MLTKEECKRLALMHLGRYDRWIKSANDCLGQAREHDLIMAYRALGKYDAYTDMAQS